MLAEKFFLVLETLRSNLHDGGAPRVVTTSRHVPIGLAEIKADHGRSDELHSASR
jgi:hypothetical protein